jgi:hypothetical protein
MQLLPAGSNAPTQVKTFFAQGQRGALGALIHLFGLYKEFYLFGKGTTDRSRSPGHKDLRALCAVSGLMLIVRFCFARVISQYWTIVTAARICRVTGLCLLILIWIERGAADLRVPV